MLHNPLGTLTFKTEALCHFSNVQLVGLLCLAVAKHLKQHWLAALQV